VLTQLVLAVSLAILISALCSLLEAALYSLPLSRIEMMGQERPALANILRKLKHNIEQPITAILTLNTVANTMGAAVAGAAAASLYGEQNLLWFSLIFTILILLFSEILPKTLGIEFNAPLARYIARPLQCLVICFTPVILVSQAMTRLIPKRSDSAVSAEELSTFARLSHKSGEIGKDQETVITNIIALRNQSVRQVMTPRTVTFSLSQELSVAEAVHFEEKWRIHSRIPVYAENTSDVVGIVRSYEVMQAAAKGSGQLTLRDLMYPVHFVPETAPLDKVMLEFFERSQHLFVVVDEYGGITGVISLEDILEEIMGREIMDESDRPENMRALARARKAGFTGRL
jgi:CBS domain containing-hemolysin-like protein